MDFVPIPTGCFQMGSPDGEAERYPNEGPMHEACLQAFELGKFEVTQAEWRQVVIYNRDPSQYKGDRRPVENVGWNVLQVFFVLEGNDNHLHLGTDSSQDLLLEAADG